MKKVQFEEGPIPYMIQNCYEPIAETCQGEANHSLLFAFMPMNTSIPFMFEGFPTLLQPNQDGVRNCQRTKMISQFQEKDVPYLTPPPDYCRILLKNKGQIL